MLMKFIRQMANCSWYSMPKSSALWQ